MKHVNKVFRTRIQSSKGNLSAAIHQNDVATEKLAILCPGYLDSKDYKHMTNLAEMLSNEGYTAVRFDPTGTWDSEGNISQYTTTQYLTDIRNVLEYMSEQGKYEHILIGGHSRGGQVALLYAARDLRISVVVAIMPSGRSTATDERMAEWKRTGFSKSTRELPEGKPGKKTFIVPISYADDKDKYDVLTDVKKIRVPTIFIAGELDNSCPKEMVQEIFESANEPKKFVVIPKMTHDYKLKDEEVKIVDNEILKLLRKTGTL